MDDRSRRGRARLDRGRRAAEAAGGRLAVGEDVGAAGAHARLGGISPELVEEDERPGRAAVLRAVAMARLLPPAGGFLGGEDRGDRVGAGRGIARGARFWVSRRPPEQVAQRQVADGRIRLRRAARGRGCHGAGRASRSPGHLRPAQSPLPAALARAVRGEVRAGARFLTRLDRIDTAGASRARGPSEALTPSPAVCAREACNAPDIGELRHNTPGANLGLADHLALRVACRVTGDVLLRSYRPRETHDCWNSSGDRRRRHVHGRGHPGRRVRGSKFDKVPTTPSHPERECSTASTRVALRWPTSRPSSTARRWG